MTPESPLPGQPRRNSASSSPDPKGISGGFALVVVLAILTLLMILAVSFISSTGSERAAASGFSSSVSARQLADVAVGVVQGQVNLATTQGASVAWASQPGMIRTFSNTDGAMAQAYKLYSAKMMISGTVDLSDDLPHDETWAANPALWTDINAPVEINGVKSYPILDPSSLDLPQAQRPEGFEITGAPGVTADSYQKAPMPVRWLYMLRDGQLVAPEASGSAVTVAGATSASGSNPIVGRIAFWTDDDTCKVNINTASEGSYWDTPRANTMNPGGSGGGAYEIDFSAFQPAQKEFQRYAGHPATTSLSAVFPTLNKNQIYDLVPRVSGGGSQAGTAIASGTIPLDSDRLYANVDELVFKPNRDVNAAGLTKAQVEQAKFFLTARSRAPETNLFNLPRVAMWPIYTLAANGSPDTTRTTAFDRLIAFCASTGTFGATNSYHPYLFQRQNPYSATDDISLGRNRELLNYLTYLTNQQTPGFGGVISAKYPTETDQILTEIFDYIRCVNLQDDALARDKRYTKPISTNTAVGLMSAQRGYGWVIPSQRGSGSKATMGFGRCYTLSELSLVFICNAAANDPATETDESHGSNIASGAGANTVLGGTPLIKGERMIQAMILPEFFSPMQGLVAMGADMQMTISGLEGLKVNDQPLFPSIAESASIVAAGGVWESVFMGGCPTYRFFGFNRGSPARAPLAGDSGTLYPFIGNPIKISVPENGTMKFSGGTVVVKLYAGATGALTSPIQTFTITFPAQVHAVSNPSQPSNPLQPVSYAEFPVPDIVPDGVPYNEPGQAVTGANSTSAENWWAYSLAGTVSNKPGRLNFIKSRVFDHDKHKYKAGAFLRPEYDVVRSVLPPHGDYRLIAASKDVSANAFGEHPYYYDSTRHIAACLSGPNASHRAETLPGNDRGGKYIANVTYDEDSVPDIPVGAKLTPEATGDFDNGIAHSVDGAYINKPDEGDVSPVGTSDYLTYPYYRLYSNLNAYIPVGDTFFSPNRQIPSSGMLGSLPTGVKSGIPWKTLLFRPQPSHPSYSQTTPDHLFMDLFWMPVVEPYAISDRFSTAGKVNLNYQILPFTYIERSTGIRAVLKSERLAAIQNSMGPLYKGSGHKGNIPKTPFRLPIDPIATLSQFHDKFADGKIFRSASEICDIYIVPEGKSLADMKGTFWTNNALTGDNLRERIYTTLYPRLTTKSNTFTVHVRVQALKQSPKSAPGIWTEGKDAVLGEYRGSTSLERFIDANNSAVPDYASNPENIPNLDPLDKFYRWRVVENRQFAP